MSVDDDVEESWLDFYEANVSVPQHPSKNLENGADIETSSFCLILNSFEYLYESEVIVFIIILLI